jgi:hypothetical protein
MAIISSVPPENYSKVAGRADAGVPLRLTPQAPRRTVQPGRPASTATAPVTNAVE